MKAAGKKTALPLLVVLLLLACLAPATAPADTLCSANEAPCSKEHALVVGSLLKGSLKSGTTYTFTDNFIDQVACKTSSVSYELTQNLVKGGAGNPIVVAPKSETFGECTSYQLGACSSVQATSLASSVKWVAGTETPGNGYVPSGSGGATNIEYTCGPVTCKYKVAAGEKNRSFTGGPAALSAKESWNEKFAWVSGAPPCPGQMWSSGERIFSSPLGGIYWTRG